MNSTVIQYIDKSALVAEIEKRINKEIQSCATDNCFGYSQGCVDSMRNILSFLDTIDVLTLDDIKEMENQAFLHGIDVERNKNIFNDNKEIKI